jgi:hypothetical protein
MIYLKNADIVAANWRNLGAPVASAAVSRGETADGSLAGQPGVLLVPVPHPHTHTQDYR